MLPCRTPFILHRAPLEGLDAAVGSLGTRMRALSLSAAQQQRQRQAPAVAALEQAAAAPTHRRCPVVLILDDSLQSLPWESLPALRSQRWGSSLQLLLHQCTPHTLPQSNMLTLEDEAVDTPRACHQERPSQALLKRHMLAGCSERLPWHARTPLRCARGPHLRAVMQALQRLLTPWQPRMLSCPARTGEA